MLLKKQTVWLLTMLSLVIVLSVYYVTLDPNQGNEMATTVNNEGNEDQAKDTSTNDDSVAQSETKEVSPTGSDQTFETLRMEVTDERNRMIEDLTIMLSNTELSATERDDANETIKQLRSINQKETILETLIVDMNYDAAFVQAEGEEVRVTVKADKLLSKAEANDIVRLVANEIPNTENVTVEIQQGQPNK